MLQLLLETRNQVMDRGQDGKERPVPYQTVLCLTYQFSKILFKIVPRNPNIFTPENEHN